MTISKQLYDLTDQYFKTKLWAKLWDSEIFAVEFKDGEIGYVSIMGGLGLTNCFVVYIGEEKLQSFFEIHSIDPNKDPIAIFEVSRKQDMLQLNFDPLEAVPEQFHDTIPKRYKMKDAEVPWFLKYTPNQMPSTDLSKKELNYMEQVLEACLFISKALMTSTPYRLGFVDVFEEMKRDEPTITIPLIKPVGKSFEIEKIDLENLTESVVIFPEYDNQVQLAKLKKIKQRGTLQVAMVQSPMPITLEPNSNEAFFPQLIVSADLGNPTIFEPTFIFSDSPTEYEEALNNIVNLWLDSHYYPKTILVSNEKAYAFFEDLARLADIKLILSEEELEINRFANDYFEEHRKKELIHDTVYKNSIEDYVKGLDNQQMEEVLDRLLKNPEGYKDEKEYELNIPEDLMPFGGDVQGFLEDHWEEIISMVEDLDENGVSFSPDGNFSVRTLSEQDTKEFLNAVEPSIISKDDFDTDNAKSDLSDEEALILQKIYETLGKDISEIGINDLLSLTSLEDEEEVKENITDVVNSPLFRAYLDSVASEVDDFSEHKKPKKALLEDDEDLMLYHDSFLYPYLDENDDVEEASYKFLVTEPDHESYEIIISSKQLLSNLEEVILEAYNLSSYNPSRFYLSNEMFDRSSEIIGQSGKDEDNVEKQSDILSLRFPTSDEFELDGFDFEIDQEFIFDYGDEDLIFNIKLEDIIDEITENPIVNKK